MENLIEWLKMGVDDGFITEAEAFKIVSIRSTGRTAEHRGGPLTVVDVFNRDVKKPRLRRDGSPWGKPGPKPRDEMNITQRNEESETEEVDEGA